MNQKSELYDKTNNFQQYFHDQRRVYNFPILDAKSFEISKSFQESTKNQPTIENIIEFWDRKSSQRSSSLGKLSVSKSNIFAVPPILNYKDLKDRKLELGQVSFVENQSIISAKYIQQLKKLELQLKDVNDNNSFLHKSQKLDYCKTKIIEEKEFQIQTLQKQYQESLKKEQDFVQSIMKENQFLRDRLKQKNSLIKELKTKQNKNKQHNLEFCYNLSQKKNSFNVQILIQKLSIFFEDFNYFKNSFCRQFYKISKQFKQVLADVRKQIYQKQNEIQELQTNASLLTFDFKPAVFENTHNDKTDNLNIKITKLKYENQKLMKEIKEKDLKLEKIVSRLQNYQQNKQTDIQKLAEEHYNNIFVIKNKYKSLLKSYQEKNGVIQDQEQNIQSLQDQLDNASNMIKEKSNKIKYLFQKLKNFEKYN